MIYPTRCGVKIVPPIAGRLQADGSAADVIQPLILRNLAGVTLLEIPADGAWTIERVVDLLDSPRACECVTEAFGANAFIGSEWIGGTEV